ncbi:MULTISPECIES: penicillin-binding transpeptidase domain-containing protein [Peribacillus]|uniref:penicillin-binding transpeptidase domain-containing protein n=1 Tax=Peribacillus TaxID=2675229 RepID=UPI00201BA911|nr:penicillin-binding transpeptidase domain-containing protein [Peribacillus frigoritolerans]
MVFFEEDNDNLKSPPKILVLKVAFALLANKITDDKYYQYLQAFGLARKTNVDLPNEVGSTINYKYKRDQFINSFWPSQSESSS